MELNSSLIAVIIIALSHIFVSKLHLSGIPRSKWLSVAGGISVTYIFLQAFPELHEFQEEVRRHELFSVDFIAEFEIYLFSLLGLTLFYGLENKTKRSRESQRKPDQGEPVYAPMFWIHVWSFGLYNFIIGYLLTNREDTSFQGMLLYSVAMAFHVIVTDHSLNDHFEHRYRRRGRWILVTCLVLGWVLSLLLHIPRTYLGLLFAFLAGGIIMNVLKEELPRERESNLAAFCTGVVLYALLLMLVS